MTMRQPIGLGLHIKLCIGRCCLLLLACLPALAPAQQLSLRYHTAAEGLGNLGVNALLQERAGALLVGTENGLYRHDGETIRRTEGGPEQVIYGMAFGTDGALWVAGQAGLYRRNGKRFVALPAHDHAWRLRWGQSLAALPDGAVLVIDVDGKLWRLAPNGDDARREPALPAALMATGPGALEVRSILVARDGAWWFGCGNALCRWHGGRLERWGAAEGVPHAPWLGLLETRDGSIWARGDRHVVRRMAGAAGFADVTPQGLSSAALQRWRPLVEDSQGRVLMVADGTVVRWQAGRWQHYGERNGLFEERIHALLPDRDGDLWLGTSGHGLVQWRGYAHWSSWTARQGLPSDAVWSIADDGAGRAWIATTRGLVSMQHGGTELRREAQAITGQVDNIVADGRGGMWLNALGGKLYHRSGTGAWRLVVHDERLRVSGLLVVDASLWVTTYDGLYTMPLDGSGPLRRRDELDRLIVANGDRFVVTACREAGSRTVWVGTGGALLRFDPEHGFARAPVAGLAPDGGVVYLACGAGRVWLRTAVGKQLMRIDLDRPAALRAVPVQAPVLNGRHIFSLLEDRRGWLWAGTDAGVVMWNGKDWRRFDESNGLAWNDCNQDALAEDSQGGIWVGTSGGVTRIDDPARQAAPAVLTAQLAEARLGNVELVPGQRAILPWSRQPLQLRWEVPIFSNRQTQHTRYRMRAEGDAWTDIARGELRYAGLGPGSHSLELVAVNDDRGLSSAPLVLDFEIVPPWWQSPPVLIAALALALLLGHSAYRLRIRQLMRRQGELVTLVQERTRMALRLEQAREDERKSLKREIHDELGQYLSALRLGISIVDMQLRQADSPLQERTRQLIATVDSTIKVVRNVVAALRPFALELGIVSALEWLAAEYKERTGIECDLHIPESELDMDDEHATAVFRIVQESLTNIARHAQATQVSIVLEQKDSQYLLEVQDNGVGFDVAERKEKSFGLLSMHERALMLGGSIELSSKPGCTSVRVQFPVRKPA